MKKIYKVLTSGLVLSVLIVIVISNVNAVGDNNSNKSITAIQPTLIDYNKVPLYLSVNDPSFTYTCCNPAKESIAVITRVQDINSNNWRYVPVKATIILTCRSGDPDNQTPYECERFSLTKNTDSNGEAIFDYTLKGYYYNPGAEDVQLIGIKIIADATSPRSGRSVHYGRIYDIQYMRQFDFPPFD